MPLHDRVWSALANLPHREGEVFRRPDGLPYERPKRVDDTSAGTASRRRSRARASGRASQISRRMIAVILGRRGTTPPIATSARCAARWLEDGRHGDALCAR